jgi:DNA-binding NtrC family response regulator
VRKLLDAARKALSLKWCDENDTQSPHTTKVIPHGKHNAGSKLNQGRRVIFDSFRLCAHGSGCSLRQIGAPIYIVDDDQSVREALSSLIRSAGLKVETFASAQEFLTGSRRDVPGCLVLDVELPGLSGLDLQQELSKAQAQLPIIFITGRGNIPMTVRAIKAGALDFLTKPINDEDLLQAIRRGLARYHGSKQATPGAGHGIEEMVGTSAALRAVLKQADIVAPADSTVLILGETGTGKELIARAVHNRSHRSSRPFVSVNCAALPQSLIAPELFGHEKGAFTGALQRRLGRFELAEGGTIFLDEIGELPAETQLALLRVLQAREFERIGGNQSIQADVRVIAATHRDLQAAMAAGTFRSDLFYRLNVFPIELAPLRRRKEDIPLLVEHFVDRYASKAGKKIQGVSDDTLTMFQSYPWPGNIRELQNVIERSVIVCETEILTVDESWLSRGHLSPPLSGEGLSGRLVAQEIEIIAAALTEDGGRVSGPKGAAAKLGVPSSTLESKIKSLKISKHRFKPV